MYTIYKYFVNTYFRLRIGLANSIYNYLRLKFRDEHIGNFNLKMLFNSIRHAKSESDLFLTSFCVQNHLLNSCSFALNSQRLFCSQKVCVKLKNVHIKA